MENLLTPKTCTAKWGDNEFCERTDIADRKTGYCCGHYQQYKKYNRTPGAFRYYRPKGLRGFELAQWFVEKGTIISNECYNWKFATNNPNGYPVASLPGEKNKKGVHRYVAQHYLNNGSILKTQEVVHHKCSNRKCINPDHLQIVTSQENTAEMLERKVYLNQISSLTKEVAKLRSIIIRNQRRIRLD